MTKVTVRPSSDVNIGGSTVIPSGTAHAALSDDDANTYVNATGPGSLVEGWPAPSSPASGAIVKEVRFVLSYAGIGYIRNISLTVGGTTFTAADIGIPPTQQPFQIARWTLSSAGTAQTESDLFPDIFTTGALINVFEAWLDWIYVQKPFAGITAPVDGSTITTNRPTFNTGCYYDQDGDRPTNWQVKVYLDSGSPDPDTTPGAVIDSGVLETVGGSGGLLTGQTFRDNENSLTNANHIAFVRFAQVVHGNLFWGDWVQSQFTVDAPAPGIPDVTLTPQPAQGRMRLVVQGHQGDATNVFLDIQRSIDGGVTWEGLRTDTADEQGNPGYVFALGNIADLTPSGDPAPVNAYDYEGGNGQMVSYRARGVYVNFFVPDSDTTFSPWSDKQTDAWEDDTADWIKNPVNPAENFQPVLQAYNGYSAQARQGVIQPLGARLPIVVTDTRAGATGSVKILCQSDEERAVLDRLVGSNDPVLLQVSPTEHAPDRYMVLGDRTQTRETVDKGYVPYTSDEFQWTEVEKPFGLLTWDSGEYDDLVLSLGPEAYWNFTDTDPGTPTNTLNDQFTGTDTTLLSAHTANSGDSWTQHGSATTTAQIITNRIRSTSGSADAIYYSSDVPASADYVVEGKVRCVSNLTGVAGVTARLSTSALTGYRLVYFGSFNVWSLDKYVAGTRTILGTWAETLGAGSERTIQLKVQEDTVSAVVNGLTRIEVTDSSVTAAGRPGVWASNASDSTGFHLDYVEARPIKSGTATDRALHGHDATLKGEFIVGGAPSLPSVGPGSLATHQSPEKGGWGDCTATGFAPFASGSSRTFVGTAIHTGDDGVPCYFGSLPTGGTNVSCVMEGVNDGGFIHRVHYNSNVNVMGVFGSAIWYDVLPEHEWFHWALTVVDDSPTGYQTIHLYINGVSMDDATQVSTGNPAASNYPTRQVKWATGVGDYLIGIRGQGGSQVAVGHAIEGQQGPQAVFQRILTDDEIKSLAQAAGLYVP